MQTMMEIMSKNDLRVNEKRWRRKKLFRKQRRYRDHTLVTIVVIFAVLLLLGWLFQVSSFNPLAN